MKLNELISRLTELRDQHGPDVEVWMVGNDDTDPVAKVESAPLYWDQPENGDIKILIWP